MFKRNKYLALDSLTNNFTTVKSVFQYYKVNYDIIEQLINVFSIIYYSIDCSLSDTEIYW